MHYSHAPEKRRNNYEQLKIERQVLLTSRFQIQGKEKQKIYFTTANMNNEIKYKYHIMTCGL